MLFQPLQFQVVWILCQVTANQIGGFIKGQEIAFLMVHSLNCFVFFLSASADVLVPWSDNRWEEEQDKEAEAGVFSILHMFLRIQCIDHICPSHSYSPKFLKRGNQTVIVGWRGQRHSSEELLQQEQQQRQQNNHDSSSIKVINVTPLWLRWAAADWFVGLFGSGSSFSEQENQHIVIFYSLIDFLPYFLTAERFTDKRTLIAVVPLCVWLL